MKILVISDSHGDIWALDKVLARCDGHIDMAVFLGDGLRETIMALDTYPNLPRVLVPGNCDLWVIPSQFPDEAAFEADSVKFFAMHGHTRGVKGGIGEAAAYAAQRGANVLLYGHTHRKDDRLVDTAYGEIRAINPGSLGRGDQTFALVETVGGKVVCGFGEV